MATPRAVYTDAHGGSNMRILPVKLGEVVVTVVGLLVAGGGATYAIRQSDAAAVESWTRIVAAERDQCRSTVEAWVDVGRMTARVAASYPTATYVAQGRTGEPRPLPAHEDPGVHLGTLLESLCREGGFDAALLLGETGVTLAATPGASATEDDRATARRAVEIGANFAAFAERDGQRVVRFVAPVRGEGASRPIAAVVVREDVGRRLSAHLRH